MTAKEKAKELFMRNFEITVDDYCAKQCALIAVDIAIKCCKDYDEVQHLIAISTAINAHCLQLI